MAISSRYATLTLAAKVISHRSSTLSQANVVVNEYGTAALCDFGLSKLFRAAIPDPITAEPSSDMPSSTRSSSGFTTNTMGGTPRYLAPELLEAVNILTPASDVYAFASTCSEVSASSYSSL